MIHTKYESLTDEQLADLFHSSNWNNNMTPDDRLAACQEVVNRDALSQGMVPCEVVPADLRGAEYGYFNNDGTIQINEHVLNDGQTVDADGNATPVPGSNAETLNTLFHENRHAYDAQLNEAVEDMLAGNAYNHTIIEDAEARGLDIDQIRASDSIYVPYSDNYDLYRVQNSEREAFKAGEEGCAKMFEGSQTRLGADSEYQAYSDRLAATDEYNESMNNLKEVYKDEHFDKTLDEQAKNLYFSDHKMDSEFENGTPESRQAAKSIVENTRGAIFVNMDAQNGYVNEHYNGNANTANNGAVNAVGHGNVNTADNTGGAKAAAGTSFSGSASEENEGGQPLGSSIGQPAGYRSDEESAAPAGSKGSAGEATGSLAGLEDDTSASSASAGSESGNEGGNAGSNDDEDADT